MIHKLALAALTVALLAAGVFSSQAQVTSSPAKTTIISKNQVFPLKSAKTVDPCAHAFCQDV